MLFTHQKAKAPKGEVIYAVLEVYNLESELEPRFTNVQHGALSFMSRPAHPIHLELNLWFYAVGEGTEPSWPEFRSDLDILMTLYLSRMVVWGEKPWAGLMSLPRGIATVFPWLHIKFLSWIARSNQISLSTPIIIKFISPGNLLIIFPFVNIFENNQRHSVRSGFKDN